ncbi:DinB family protein [Amycolatopsis sp. WAC 01376]|uniref:DinB family protein n=1 Tax=Amycolatopsis sp. WAC 01376 TaxID=2203195 RepID=UPI000F790FF7|nr:DinB family protein [Amycolatopsis sp. WAC 01376]RSM65781.1 DinB family protein [Amycolatopsis sp. WAC 01376]
MAETPEPSPVLTDTRELLLGYLDHNATAILRKLDGLSEIDLRRSTLPSGWTPLGMIKHLACTERLWIRHMFGGEHVDFSWPGTAEQEWRVGAGEPTAGIIAFFHRERENCADLVATTPLDALAARTTRRGGVEEHPTLAWILFHLAQSFARHAGHLDVSRELLDGVTGK